LKRAGLLFLRRIADRRGTRAVPTDDFFFAAARPRRSESQILAAINIRLIHPALLGSPNWNEFVPTITLPPENVVRNASLRSAILFIIASFLNQAEEHKH
jgi:hypothetical protein